MTSVSISSKEFLWQCHTVCSKVYERSVPEISFEISKMQSTVRQTTSLSITKNN